MADRPHDPAAGDPQALRDAPIAAKETKPHPDMGRPSTTTGNTTRATDAATGLGAPGGGQKSGPLRMVMMAVLAVVAVLVIVGLFA
ncbi:hypothetical protein [Caenispirillum bisanense]|uniref:hypothetical protein n=1 Tax=Caenispirillum bisanense TaxID=414052 RepID=UPI0031D47E46